MYFLLSNLLIVFPVAIIMYAGIAFLFIPFELLNRIFGLFLNWLIILTNDILYKIENLPFSALEGIWINTFELLLISLLIILFIFWQSFKRKLTIWLGLISVLALSISISYKSIHNFTREELIFYSLKKNTAIAYLYQGKAVVISDIEALDKLINYSIKPVLLSKGTDEIHHVGIDKLVSGDRYWLGVEFMQFGNFRVIRWKNEFNNLALSNKIDVDAVLIQNIKFTDLSNLKKRVNFKTLILESDLPDYTIQKYLEEAKKLNINCLSLKKNPAYIVEMQ